MPADFLFYFVSIVIIYAFYIAVYLGVFVSVPEYIVVWYTFIQVFLCLVLMYRYHPFRDKFEYNEFDVTSKTETKISASIIFPAVHLCSNNLLINSFQKPRPQKEAINKTNRKNGNFAWLRPNELDFNVYQKEESTKKQEERKFCYKSTYQCKRDEMLPNHR